jgi:hypothetical protein
MDINSIFSEFAEAFVGIVISDGDIAFADELDREKLDYTLESLIDVDTYFSYVRENIQEVSDRELDNTMLWGGAYVGEVIKKISPKKYNWIVHSELISKYPMFEKLLPHSYGTRAVLLAENGEVTTPVNKVVRLIKEGSENNLHYYASAEK